MQTVPVPHSETNPESGLGSKRNSIFARIRHRQKITLFKQKLAFPGRTVAVCLAAPLLLTFPILAGRAEVETGSKRGTIAESVNVAKVKRGALWNAKATPHSEAYQWRNVEIVGGGFVSGILFSPKQSGLLYARTDIGGAYRWNPTTKRWIPLTDWVSQSESNLLGVESLAVDPTDAHRVYLALGTYTASWAGNGVILRSSNQGATWQRTAMPFKMGGNEDGRSIGERLAVDPAKNSILYFGSRNNGLWRSEDQAVTWKKVDSFPVSTRTNGIGIGFVVFDPRSGASGKGSSTLYVGVASPGVTLYRSRDSGATWQAVPGTPTATSLLPHHGVLAADGMLYLTYGNAPGPNGMTDGAVWKLDTNSDTWTDITPIKPGRVGSFGYAGLALDPLHPGTLMVTTMDKWSTGDDLLRSRDGGKTWTSLKSKATRDSSGAPFLNWDRGTADIGHWMGALALDPFHPGHVLYGTGATIWGSDDADTADADTPTHWTVRAQGLEETAVLDLASPPVGPHLISALGDIGGFRHDDLTRAPADGIWKNPVMNTTQSLDFAEGNPLIVARVGSGRKGNTGALSQDGGKTWTPFATEPPASKGSGVVAVSADGNSIAWTPEGDKAHVSRDHGVTWTICQGLPDRMNVIADRVASGKFYALAANGGKLYASSDGGATFTPQAQNLPTGRCRLRATPKQEGDLWMPLFTGGLFHSTDVGSHFTKLADVQEGNALGFGKAAPGQTYPTLYLTGKVADVQGVFRSDDKGLSWTRINDDQHQYGWIGQTITGDPRVYGRVYLGTNGRGILVADPIHTP